MATLGKMLGESGQEGRLEGALVGLGFDNMTGIGLTVDLIARGSGNGADESVGTF